MTTTALRGSTHRVLSNTTSFCPQPSSYPSYLVFPSPTWLRLFIPHTINSHGFYPNPFLFPFAHHLVPPIPSFLLSDSIICRPLLFPFITSSLAPQSWLYHVFIYPSTWNHLSHASSSLILPLPYLCLLANSPLHSQF